MSFSNLNYLSVFVEKKSVRCSVAPRKNGQIHSHLCCYLMLGIIRMQVMSINDIFNFVNVNTLVEKLSCTMQCVLFFHLIHFNLKIFLIKFTYVIFLLFQLFGSDDPFYGLSYNPVDERAKASNSGKLIQSNSLHDRFVYPKL